MPTLDQFKQEICDIGRRLYNRGFAAANDGNITCRVSDTEVLCTPTMHSKGFLHPADICLIDMDGRQLAGEKKRSSEALLHLEILKARPDVKSVVHCHPPHATAFAVAREAVPSCVLPEVEVFLGNVPIARYETPSTQALAETILPFVHQSNVVMLANHGTVSFGETVERAYWWTEILDAHCRILLLAKQLGRVEYLSAEQTRELIDLKKRWGYPDPRQDPSYAGADLFADDVFRASWPEAGVRAGAFGAPAWSRAAAESKSSEVAHPTPDSDEEAFIERIAERVAQKLRAALKPTP
ncbi:MAG: aldolase [Planctomycetota bacterium]|nr:MAG: aldolase [Planctomycetota bacterium]